MEEIELFFLSLEKVDQVLRFNAVLEELMEHDILKSIFTMFEDAEVEHRRQSTSKQLTVSAKKTAALFVKNMFELAKYSHLRLMNEFHRRFSLVLEELLEKDTLNALAKMFSTSDIAGKRSAVVKELKQRVNEKDIVKSRFSKVLKEMLCEDSIKCMKVLFKASEFDLNQKKKARNLFNLVLNELVADVALQYVAVMFEAAEIYQRRSAVTKELKLINDAKKQSKQKFDKVLKDLFFLQLMKHLKLMKKQEKVRNNQFSVIRELKLNIVSGKYLKMLSATITSSSTVETTRLESSNLHSSSKKRMKRSKVKRFRRNRKKVHVSNGSGKTEKHKKNFKNKI
jgi:hypothetical protein